MLLLTTKKNDAMCAGLQINNAQAYVSFAKKLWVKNVELGKIQQLTRFSLRKWKKIITSQQNAKIKRKKMHFETL